MSGRRRGAPMNLRVNDISTLLERAGWTTRNGGDHFVLSKPGHENIVLSARITSMGQFKSIERVLGVQLEQLIGRKRHGVSSSPTEMHRRLDLARQMIRCGFPVDFTSKTAGLGSLTANKFTPLMLEALDNDEVLTRYWGRSPTVIPPVTPTVTPVTPVVPTITWSDEPVEASRSPVLTLVRPTEHVEEAQGDTVGALLELIAELRDEVKGITSVRAERSVAYAERLRVVRGQALKVESSLATASAALRELLDTLGGY